MLEINGSISGSLSEDNTVQGDLDTTSYLLGGLFNPDLIDNTCVHYNTTDAWNRQTFLIAERGHIYIYKDAETTYVDGVRVVYPGIKIGDGTSYLIDMPFTFIGNDHDKLADHIADSIRHITRAERVDWNEKVSVSVISNNEELKFKK